MIKSKRGVSLVVLIATLAIMVLLTTTVTISAAAVSNNAKRVKFATEIAYVQECVNAYNLKNLDSYPVNNSITINLTGVSAKALSQFNNETQTNSQIILYEIDFNLLGKTELKYGNKASNDDVYAVSKDTGKVYYVKGEKIGSDTYFTLTNDLKKVINYVDVSTNQVNKDGIIFLPSTIEWTNQKITADIKVPNNYTAVTVTATQNGSSAANMSISSTNARYNIYTQNTLNSNYEITIMYTDNNISKKQTFNVNNFDSTKPTLTLSTLNSIDSQSQKSNYVKVENTTVGNSGLKVLKYENELIQAHLVPTYFKSNGMNVENNIIKIPYATRNITVYLEDKAGNYTFKTLDVDKLYKDYIKNGLVLHLDGYRNTRSGHNPSAYVWEDLSGNYNDGNLNGF
ncbi:MAG: type II secretion system protein, partial [Clostridia bacterium]